MRYVILLSIVCILLINPNVFAQEAATPEVQPFPTVATDSVNEGVAALPTLAPLTESELAADGTLRPGWLDALTILTGLLTVGTVATVAVNISRKKPAA